MSFTSLLTSSDQHYQADSNTNNGVGKSSLGERRGYAVPKFNSVTSPSLPRYQPFKSGGGGVGDDGVGVFSPSSYFALPHGLSPSELLDSPVLLSAYNILPSPTTGTMPAHGFDWKQDMIKNENKNFPDFSFQTQMKPQASYGQDSWFYGQQQQPKREFASSEKANIESDYASNHSFSPEIATLQTNDDPVPSNYNQQQNRSSSHTIKDPKKLDDGYNWRKYGQKQVKGSENPRSYYKCTHPNCPTKKKVEITVQGHITEIVYKGTHNHPKPQSTRRSSSSAAAAASQSQVITAAVSNDNGNIPEQSYGSNVTNKTDSFVGTPENSTISIENDDFEHSSHKRKSGRDELDDEDELDAKRWKGETENNESVSALESRTVKEPRVVVQTLSDIDILDDGFRWRKYGQKVVKGNPNPRSYYKCTYQGCNVRKHVERSSQDPRAVITSYEGKHNHDVPAARGSGSSRAMPAHSSNYSMPMHENSTRLLEPENVPHTLQYEDSLRSRMDSIQGNGGGLFFRR